MDGRIYKMTLERPWTGSTIEILVSATTAEGAIRKTLAQMPTWEIVSVVVP